MNNKLCLHATGVARVLDRPPKEVPSQRQIVLFPGRKDLKDKQLDTSNEDEQTTSREINNVSQMVWQRGCVVCICVGATRSQCVFVCVFVKEREHLERALQTRAAKINRAYQIKMYKGPYSTFASRVDAVRNSQTRPGKDNHAVKIKENAPQTESNVTSWLEQLK